MRQGRRMQQSSARPLWSGIRLLRQILTRTFWRLCPRSWRQRLLGCMLAVALTPMLAFMWIQHRHTRAALSVHAANSLHVAATRTALRVDDLLRHNLERVALVAKQPELVACLEDRTACSLGRAIPALLDSLSGEETVFLAGHTLLDASGTVVAGEARPRREEFEEASVQQALVTGLPAFALATDRGLDPADPDAPERPGVPEYFLHFAAPVFHRTEPDRILGVLRVAYTLGVLQQLAMADTEWSGKMSFPVLLDERNRVLACGRVSFVEAGQMLMQPAWILEARTEGEESSLQQGLKALASPQSMHEVQLKDSASGRSVFSVAMLQEAPWKVAFFQPVSVVMGPMRSQLQWLAGLGVGAAALAAAVAVLVARMLTTPVRRLTQAARRVSAGDLAAVAPVSSLDEIGELTQAFNAMTERLVRRLEIELLVAQISRRCLESGLDEADAAVQHVLGMLGQFLAADRLYTVILDTGNDTMLRIVHDWRAEGVPVASGRSRLVPASQYDWLFPRLRSAGTLRVADVQTLPPEAAAERSEFVSEGVRSFLAVPIASSSGLRGALVACAMWGRRAFLEEEASLVAMAAEMLGNVQERNEALGALRASEERYALAQKAANIGSWEWDISTGQLFWSDAIAPMFGMRQGEFSGTYKSFLERVHPDDRKLVLDAVGASFRHGVGYNVEHRILHANGSERWVAEVGEVSRDDQGRPERMRGILQDITERKWAEEALARLNRRLEQLVEARTRDLGHKAMELETANARLMELDQMKTSFLASVSHELRTPLTSILGFAKLIAKDFIRHYQCLAGDDCRVADRGRRILDNLDIIGQEGERLTRLINDLLDLAKIESGKVDWRDQRISPELLITRAVRAVSGQFAQKPEVALEVALDPDVPDIQADPDRMAQVLINLLHNAAKFTSHGSVRLEARAPRPGVLQIRVEDTGQGIHLADLERIFDKFYQVAGQDTRIAKPEGTGLGLAICRQIVEHYHGAIWAESAWGRGSTFVLELPALSGDRLS